MPLVVKNKAQSQLVDIQAFPGLGEEPGHVMIVEEYYVSERLGIKEIL